MPVTVLQIVYIPFCHVPLMMQSRDGHFEVEDLRTEVDARTSPEI